MDGGHQPGSGGNACRKYQPGVPVAERRVLIVDDDQEIRSILEEALTLDGYRVETAENGLRALHVLAVWRVDLILLDLNMPIMDGRAFRAEQRLLHGMREVPLLVLSADFDADEQWVDMGAQSYIAKPIDLAMVLATIAHLLHQA
jgi:CheY-like chemotaxis protein